MSELTFEQMLEDSFKTIRNGEVVDGTVIDVKPDEIILNIGYKADGIISRSEFTNEPNVDLTTLVKAGDKLSAKVLKVNDGEGQVLLTYKRIAAEKGNERLKEAFENKEVLKATVAQILGGGLIHPKVLELNGIDSKKYSGFAFGLGFDRFPKMKYDIPYPQLMYDNDVRFLRQFK